MKSMLLLPALLLAPVLHAADGSLQFSPTSQQRVEVPNFAGLGISTEVTVDLWALSTSNGIAQSVFMLNPDTATNRFQSHLNYFNGSTYWDFGDIGNGGRVQLPNRAAWLNNWTHFALTAKSGGGMKIYANGVEVASVSTINDLDLAALTTQAAKLSIGGIPGTYFEGKIDDFRIWNVAHSEADIRRDMTGPLTGSEPGLLLYFKFDEGTGTTAANSATATGATFNGTLMGTTTTGMWSTPARTTYIVTSNGDAGAGTLRQALTDAAAASGPALITFDPALNGGTIRLGSEIVINDAGGFTVDASALSGGVTIDGGTGDNRIFTVSSEESVALKNLTLTGGGGSGAAGLGDGGAIYNNGGTLTLTQCSLSGNSASLGGAIFSSGTLTLTHCTFSGNSASEGGAIYNIYGTLTLTHCTLSVNTASYGGGAIYNFLNLTLNNSITAGNFAPNNPSSADIRNVNSGAVNYTRIGANIVQFVSNSGPVTESGPPAISADPRLATLASNGGPTQTLCPQPGSPAIDAGGTTALSTDQRGFPRNLDGDDVAGALPDIGAVEVRRTLVTTAADQHDTPTGAQTSLREALRDDTASDTADHITFSPTIFTGGAANTLTLDAAKGEIAFTATVAISGAGVGGITLDGGEGTNRVFSIGVNRDVYLHRLTLTGGGGTGEADSGFGGAVRNMGTLMLDECTVAENTATDGGGGIWSPGPLTLLRSTFSSNTAGGEGGAVRQEVSAFAATHCTFGSNSGFLGGGVSTADGGAAAFTHCTFSLNHATGLANLEGQPAAGGGLFSYGKNVTLTNCVLTGNTTATAGGGADVNAYLATFARTGANLAADTKFSGVTPDGPAFRTGAAQFTALAAWGGPTHTFYPQSGAALGRASVVAGLTADQRGAKLPASGRDLGAVEARAALPRPSAQRHGHDG